jgi:hypothetical protein
LKKIFQSAILLILMLIFAGCLPTYHYGYMGTEHAPLLNKRDTGLANYSGISISTGGASNENENSMTAKLRHQINYTGKWYSFSTHAEAYTGFHSVEAVEEYKENSYNYYGVAPQITTSIFYPFETARLGVYGSLGTFWEYGPYVDWLKEAKADSLINISGDKTYDKVFFGGIGILFEKKYSKEKMTSYQIGTGVPGMVQGFINFNNHNHIISIGFNTVFEGSGSVSFSYMRKW